MTLFRIKGIYGKHNDETIAEYERKANIVLENVKKIRKSYKLKWLEQEDKEYVSVALMSIQESLEEYLNIFNIEECGAEILDEFYILDEEKYKKKVIGEKIKEYSPNIPEISSYFNYVMRPLFEVSCISIDIFGFYFRFLGVR